MKFLVNSMLGKLSRFLRIFGYDTVYANDLEKTEGYNPIPDEIIAEYAFKNDRIILTRDYPFYNKYKDHNIIFLEGEGIYSYLAQLKSKLNLSFNFDLATARCSICNSHLIKVTDINTIRNEVKFKSFQFNNEFFQCSKCKKIYWKGTHIENVLRNIRKNGL